jgi:hypothetical protein
MAFKIIEDTTEVRERCIRLSVRTAKGVRSPVQTQEDRPVYCRTFSQAKIPIDRASQHWAIPPILGQDIPVGSSSDTGLPDFGRTRGGSLDFCSVAVNDLEDGK